MNEKEQQIILGAAEVFMKYGIKSVNMDDISKNLGISKKTLYKYVKDKKDVVKKAMDCHNHMEEGAMNAICSKQLNAIDEAYEMMYFIVEMLRNIHPSIIFDMEKYYPDIMLEMKEKRNEGMYKCIFNNIEKGIKDGLYRSNLNADIIAKLYLSSIDGFMNQDLFPSTTTNLPEVYMEMFRYHIRGLASDKGREYLKEKVKQSHTINTKPLTQ